MVGINFWNINLVFEFFFNNFFYIQMHKQKAQQSCRSSSEFS